MESEMTIKAVMDNFNDVCNILYDDESKDIYCKKLLYLISDDTKYIDDIVKTHLPMLKVWGQSDKFIDFVKSISQNDDLIIYGAGRDAKRSIDTLKKFDCPVTFCDRDQGKQSNGFYGYKVISPDELFAEHKNAKILINTSKFLFEVQHNLLNHGFTKEQILDAHILLSMYKPGGYFDVPFLNFSSNEIFVDAGAYHLETTRSLANFSRLKKTFAFEPNPESFRICERIKQQYNMDYVNLYPYGTWSKKAVLHFDTTTDTGSTINDSGDTDIEVVSIDDIIGDAKVTFIKMDIEGAELESLKGSAKTIVNNHPKLAICIYHKPEDMITIPLYIKSLVPEYKFYVRHLSNLWTETVLYAV